MRGSRHLSIPPPDVDDFVARNEISLIEFWVDWSGESFLVGTAVEKLLRSRPGLAIRVGRVDADTHPDVCARFHALSPPVLLLFHHGEVIARHNGLITADGLSKWLDEAIHGVSHSIEEES